MRTTLVRASDARVTTSPHGVMTTLASPTLSGSDGASLWRVAFAAGASGPEHAFDSEQIWALASGEAVIVVDGERFELNAGDTIQIAGGVTRRVFAVTDVEFVVSGSGTARVRAPGHPADGTTPPWIG